VQVQEEELEKEEEKQKGRKWGQEMAKFVGK